MKKVSVIIRTCNRPTLLLQAIRSVMNQTINNEMIEIIVIEDGKPNSIDVVRTFGDKIKYHATVEQVGRVRAANIGLSMAMGKYVNFLDDDDMFLPVHVETLLEALESHHNADAVHASSLERRLEYSSTSHFDYRVISELETFNEPIVGDVLLFKNMFPIQAVMFSRHLYDQYGGMDENLKLLEDWDLWIKYSLHGSFHFVDSVTSVYHIPADLKKMHQRNKELKAYERKIQDKYRDLIERSSYKRENIFNKIYKSYKKHGASRTTKKIYENITKYF